MTQPNTPLKRAVKLVSTVNAFSMGGTDGLGTAAANVGGSGSEDEGPIPLPPAGAAGAEGEAAERQAVGAMLNDKLQLAGEAKPAKDDDKDKEGAAAAGPSAESMGWSADSREPGCPEPQPAPAVARTPARQATPPRCK